MSKRSWVMAGVWVSMVIGAPLAGRFVRQERAGRCVFDGLPIVPIYRVRIVDAAGRSQPFCCVGCAETWLSSDRSAAQVFVTDETTGKELEVEQAYFVRSSIVTTPTTGNRVHAFGQEADALRHAEEAEGRLLTRQRRPLRSYRAAGKDPFVGHQGHEE